MNGDMLGRSLNKDQILFNKRILTLRIEPTECTTFSESAQHYFELGIQSLQPKHGYFLSLLPKTENFICQRIRLDFPQPYNISTCSNLYHSGTATVTLSNRSFSCLVPR